MDVNAGVRLKQGTRTEDGHAEIEIIIKIENTEYPQFIITAEIHNVEGRDVIIVKRK